MSDWITLALGVLKEVAGATGQIAENKGEKIPMQADEIKALSKKRAKKYSLGEATLVRKADIQKWKAIFNVQKKYLPLDREIHGKNIIENLINGGLEILGIERQQTDGKYWIEISYAENDFCKTYYVEGKRV